MDKLKTLKDFYHETIDINQKHKEKIGVLVTNAVNIDLLKQEAIKHIKHLRAKPLGTQKKPKEPIEFIIGIQISNWIARFFNIEEEDLSIADEKGATA